MSFVNLWMKLKIKKIIYSVKGYYWTLKYKGKFYLTNSPNHNILHTYTHYKNNIFYAHYEGIEPITGFIYYEAKYKNIPYWVIGVLDKKIIN